MRRIMIWCLLTEKRLLKKISYLAVLLLVPVLVLAMRQGASQESGMVTIGLYTPDEAGSLSDQVLRRLSEEKSVLRYLRYETEEEAIRALESQKVDAVWILPEHLELELEKMAKRGVVTPVATVVEREDDIALTFTREVLCSRIYPEYTYQVYREFVRQKVGDDAPEEAELLERYERLQWKGSIFQAQYLDGSGEIEESYFLAPIRGLLAIWLMLTGFAAILYHKKDELCGVYDGIPCRKRLLYSFGLQAVVLCNGGVIFLIACGILGVLGPIWRELGLLALFLLMISVFCNLIGLLIGRIEGIGILIPVMTLLMIAFCPIFLSIRAIPWLQSLLPPYLYLGALRGTGRLPWMAVYVGAGALLCLVVNRLKYGK